MEVILQGHEAAAAFAARVFLGTLFFFQGYDAVFNIKVKNIVNTYQTTFSNKGIPRILIKTGVWFTSYTELIAGALLVAGLIKYFALYLLGVNLIVASVAFSITQPMWDMRFVFPRLALLVFLLAIPTTWDIWTLDSLINCIKQP
ncbi:MAG: DoxX family membrane protein [Bacteroidia bacterium]|jgi:uncharacterized membrane protein YphA (DoxX/SURF4 family)